MPPTLRRLASTTATPARRLSRQRRLTPAPPLPQEEPEAFDASLDRPIREPQRDVEVSALEPDAMASLSSRIFEVQEEEWLKRKLEELR